MSSKRKKKGSVISTIIMLIAAAVFVVALYNVVMILREYKAGEEEYEKIAGDAIEIEEPEDVDDDGYRVDFEKLLSLNEDTVAWIRFPKEPAIINYPVVQGDDNEYYLHKTFTANENTLGTIFIDTDNAADFSDPNTIIYGHRMRDGSMFRKIQDYEDKDFWEENPIFYIYTVDGRRLTYEVYSVGQVEDTSDTYLIGFADEDSFADFLAMTKEVSIYDTGREVDTNDRIVTLSTCTSASDNHRFVVRGVLTAEWEIPEE